LLGLAGLHLSLAKFINHYLAKKQYDKIKGILISSFAITSVASVLILLVLYFSSNFIGEKIFKIEELGAIIAIFSIGIPFYVFTQLSKYYFFALKKLKYAIISESIFEKVLNLVFLIIVISVSASLLTLSWTYILSLIISTVVAALLLRRGIKNILKKAINTKFELKQIMSFSFPLM